jgi:hypothetical protein
LIVQLKGEGELIVLLADISQATVEATAARFGVPATRGPDNRLTVAVQVDQVVVRLVSVALPPEPAPAQEPSVEQIEGP